MGGEIRRERERGRVRKGQIERMRKTETETETEAETVLIAICSFYGWCNGLVECHPNVCQRIISPPVHQCIFTLVIAKYGYILCIQ